MWTALSKHRRAILVGLVALELWVAPTTLVPLPAVSTYPPEACASERSAPDGCAFATPRLPEVAEIERHSVCIGSSVASAGELGPMLLYRRTHLGDGRLAVGYYAFFSDERPWGDNWLSWSVLPALLVDLVYTRFLFALPGFRRARYGPADVEGFRIIYDVGDGGQLSPAYAVADDSSHRLTAISRAELFALDPDRIVLVTDSWSHHLGTRTQALSALVSLRCYGASSIRPVSSEVWDQYALGRRARPAAM
jgi:hypothetical protein